LLVNDWGDEERKYFLFIFDDFKKRKKVLLILIWEDTRPFALRTR
jgi:hypothetical protein